MADDSLNKSTTPYTYPLERYLIARPKRESKIDFSKFVDHSTTEKDFEDLAKISNILKLAEEEMDNVISKMSPKKPQTVYLREPAYFDEDFDPEQYIRDLVEAKINNMNIVEEDESASKGLLIHEQSNAAIRESHTNEIRQTEKSLKVGNELPKTNKHSSSHGNADNLNIKLTNDIGVNNNVNRIQSGQNIQHRHRKRRLQKVLINTMEIPAWNSEQTRLSPQENEIHKISVKNSQVFEIKSQVHEQRENTVEKLPLNKLTFQIMPSLNIRTQLMERKIPSLDIFPEDENNSYREKTSNVGFVEIKYSQEKGQAHKKVHIKEDTNAMEEFSFVGSSDSQIEISTDKLLTMDQDGRDDFLEKILRPHRILSSAKKHSNRDTRRADTILKNYESPYMFLGGSNVDRMSSDYNSRLNRSISKLKKYAIPEIQKIYSSKPIESFNSVYSNKKRPSSVNSSSVPLRHSKNQPRSRHIYLHSGNAYDNNSPSTSGYSRQKSNAEYIPYTHLTVGGLNTEDVDLKGKNKKCSSQSSKTEIKTVEKELLEDNEVVPKVTDTEKVDRVADDIPEDGKLDYVDDSKSSSSNNKSVLNYADDFDEDDSKSQFSTDKSKSIEENYSEESEDHGSSTLLKKDKKSSKLKMKTNIDIFDFIHHIEKKDDFTQSNLTSHLSFKETQTSPRDEDAKAERLAGGNKINPDIIEPKMDIANITLREMIELQERLSFINSQILSNQLDNRVLDVSSSDIGADTVKVVLGKAAEVHNVPKNTQTSPMKTSQMMTSPAKMISQILSPVFHNTYTDAQTSPLDPTFGVIDEISDVTQRDHIVSTQTEILPSSQAILSNINSASRVKKGTSRIPIDLEDNRGSTSKGKTQDRLNVKFKTQQENKDSTDAYTDVSHSESSDTHSIGEINLRIFKKKSVLIKSQSSSHSTSASFTTNSSSDVHFDSANKKSDGELSIGQVLEKI